MNRRQAMMGMGVAAAGISGLLGAVSSAAAQATPDHGGHAAGHGTAQGDHWDHCLKTCLECFAACEAGFRYCLDKVTAGDKPYADCAALCADCPELCKACASLMARRSKLTLPASVACAACCDVCADACEAIKGDPTMVALAKTCRDCAASCRAMAKILEK